MWLLIDAGNTKIKWAIPDLARGGAALAPVWQQAGVANHGEIAELARQWQGLPLTHALISNVAGTAVREQLGAILHSLAPQLVPVWFASVPEVAGLRNAYRHPTQLGCDRFAAAIGAHALCPHQPLIVATCGTATTIDAVSADGVFRGGMILPGLKLMAESLARNTAQLPEVGENFGLEHVFADNTDQAIISGCISAQVGAIKQAVSAFQQMESHKVTCVISGGAAPYLLPHLNLTTHSIDNLVLTGLYVVAQSTST